MKHQDEIGTSGADQTFPVPGETADDPSIGELINERYSVLSRIAEGPTGKLYQSRDVKTQSEVTLKVLAGWPGLDASLIRQLREELSVTRALTGKQSNIALVHDCDLTADGRVVVVMEPLKGRTLWELIQRHEPIPVERALRLASQIAEGLHAAHGLGLVHGALRTEHVLVQASDTVKVVGFEVARLRTAGRASFRSDSVALPGGANGLRQAERAEVLTESADTQAVGMVLLEILTSGVRPGPQGVRTVPAEVRHLVMQVLVRSPGAPSYDMGALAKALSAGLNPRPQPRPQPSASRAWRRARPRPHRGRGTLISAGVLAIVISALAAWLTWSIIASLRRPVTAEVPAVPAHEVVADPASSLPDPAMPPQSSDGVVGLPLSPPPVTRADPLAPERPVDPTALSPDHARRPASAACQTAPTGAARTRQTAACGSGECADAAARAGKADARQRSGPSGTRRTGPLIDHRLAD